MTRSRSDAATGLARSPRVWSRIWDTRPRRGVSPAPEANRLVASLHFLLVLWGGGLSEGMRFNSWPWRLYLAVSSKAHTHAGPVAARSTAQMTTILAMTSPVNGSTADRIVA